jgi:uncharacterized protein YqfA (UPF0365 family)
MEKEAGIIMQPTTVRVFICHLFILFSFLPTGQKICTLSQKILMILNRHVHQSLHKTTPRYRTH